ncbi:MAG: tRNA uridine(34) 5-carboxymethylaminomethyl modification radical SAM/GNAT enzyme Elp3 [Candidatus Komeilibacteria bacterium CG11_big_fil_rev_8_21_14_0_20_36_20]|uniref:tRNA carboxymethyluridine synthase n=1 Tax=Candidatus Komeilibacteria bacterium CG11_big_fil_rev_8_21_14_0_20_36_20 TaxID=1974477 RepID=A0A2H0NDJ6_9BACT|nr:MAG: tRNA uridine(34) 5-carboxymethylaminomethyl modification radical SAM/GNAT enzyme Elp3 [Candidatus Komeilibacteria bacterium CG11_big_fil_rev_8_21_14_0_20_36_20]PIR81852.1 MAG: tRNA uridine(34) 5-carboxymethylaminomethyl modification radical SAM/GNAT enzyme Elp3 [Candidatus Komeilibacteria bacterium CG10_big_fil_rev_8_21_14_0_10_36_65]PJC55060.1 MAG: tRNA uridine(34) 5-carboxymethylaminomethyl modification radical SAM/GNAT enzyme Elp3 [Candidatus Komeilibacteria bacterium CG_4_9_14_0_2_um_
MNIGKNPAKRDKILEKIVTELASINYASQLDFVRKLRQTFSKYKLTPLSKATLISVYRQLLKNKKLQPDKRFSQLLTKRAVRTLSGVSVITVLTKPFKCPGQCIYCPDEPQMPKSYLSNEPAAARAKMNLFDPIRQINMRIQALENNGHQVDKLELLILGGTWSAYTTSYQEKFIRDCFYAVNTKTQKNKRQPFSLEKEQKINETAKYKIIGLTIETRPDFITEKEIKKLRRYGCTRVQLGVQHTDNQILKKIKRGHTLKQSIQATKLLKQTGFKVDHHYMPDLPGSTPQKDLKMFQYVFSSPDLQPDQIKIYPCIVSPYSQLYQLYQQKKHQPYSEKKLLNLLLKIKLITPPYVRINRLIRDIPKENIVAGNKITNLRQLLQKELKKKDKKCQCLRCREVRSDTKNINKAILVKKEYSASDGQEIFLSYESSDSQIVYAFLRLRFNNNSTKNIFPELKNASIVRELHVYGQMIPTDLKEEAVYQTQHLGIGKKLMQEAEKLTKQNGLNKIAVIAGIGVRNYYRKLGYKLEDTYLTKKL